MPDPFVTRSEASAWLALDPVDANAMLLLGGVIDAATSALIDAMNGDPRSTDYVDLCNGSGAGALALRFGPIQAVGRVTVDGLAVPPEQITWDDVLVYRTLGFPAGQRNVSVSYTAGFDDTPGAVKLACLYTLKAMWTARRADMNSTGEQFPGIMSSAFWPAGPGTVPPSARSLVSNYTVRFFP